MFCMSATPHSVSPALKGCSPTGRPRSRYKFYVTYKAKYRRNHCGLASGRAARPFPPLSVARLTNKILNQENGASLRLGSWKDRQVLPALTERSPYSDYKTH